MGFWKWVVGFKDKACKIRAICDSPCQERWDFGTGLGFKDKACKIRAICDSPCQERRMQPRELHQEPKFRFNNGIFEVG